MGGGGGGESGSGSGIAVGDGDEKRKFGQIDWSRGLMEAWPVSFLQCSDGKDGVGR
jgi:hypothetical protein